MPLLTETFKTAFFVLAREQHKVDTAVVFLEFFFTNMLRHNTHVARFHVWR